MSETLREAEARDPFAPHDPGCQCWPHVSQQAAIEAAVQAATAEYHEGKAALARSESPPPEGLTEALRPWLRHKDWCNVKTDDPPDTERCKCGLRAALVR